jgi:hypothetical protein
LTLRAVERVGGGVGGLGEHGAGAGQDPGHELDGADEKVRRARDDHGAARGRLFRISRTNLLVP